MSETKLEAAFNKKFIPSDRYFLDVLYAFPENEWFAPNNSKNEAFEVCRQLSDFNLIAIKKTPRYSDGSFLGWKIQFKYNNNLDY